MGFGNAYKAAKLTPINELWQPIRSVEADKEYWSDIDLVRARCRDLVRNNALASAVITTLQDYVASTGLTPVQGEEGAMNVFREWAESCSLSGSASWEDINRDLVGAEAETGDVLLLTPINTNKKGIQTSIELIEGDRVRTPERFTNNQDGRGRTIRHGVVFDNLGVEIGYYVARINPRTSVYMTGGSEAYHYFDCLSPTGRLNARLVRRPDKLRPGQTRQLPIFVSVAQQFWDVDAILDAAIATTRSKAMIAAFLKSGETQNIDAAMGVDQASGATEYKNDYDEPVNVGSIPNGAMVKVPYGTEIETLVPAGNSEVDVLLVRSIRIMGAALGIPYELIARDFSQTNFSSGKLSHDGFFRGVDRWNRGNARQYADPLYRLVCVEAMLRGDPRVAGLTPERLKVKWIGGPRSYNAQPDSESKAEETRMNNNLTTEEMISAEFGVDFKDVLRSKARVLEAQRAIEVEFDLPEGSLSRKSAETKKEPTPKEYMTEEEEMGEDKEMMEDEKDAKAE